MNQYQNKLLNVRETETKALSDVVSAVKCLLRKVINKCIRIVHH